jgi:hypothetical protein
VFTAVTHRQPPEPRRRCRRRIGRFGQRQQQRIERAARGAQRVVDHGQRAEGGHRLDDAGQRALRGTGRHRSRQRTIASRDPIGDLARDAGAELDRYRAIAGIEQAHGHSPLRAPNNDADAARAAWS